MIDYSGLCVVCRECATTLSVCADCAKAAACGKWLDATDAPAGPITHDGRVFAPVFVLPVANGCLAVRFAELREEERTAAVQRVLFDCEIQ